MKKFFVFTIFVITLLVFIGCVKRVYVPVPTTSLTIEAPPRWDPVENPVRVDFIVGDELVPYVCIPLGDFNVLWMNIKKWKEYNERCYLLFGKKQPTVPHDVD